MEKISLWIKLCSISSVVSAVFIAIVPESKLKSAYKTLCSLIMLVVFFSVFTSIESFDINEFGFEGGNVIEISEKTDELLVVEGEKMLDKLIENKLYEVKIEAVCKSEMQIIDDSLKTMCIYLYGSFSDEQKEKAKTIIYKCLKEECEVVFAKRNE